jgi:hypothetical protein
LCGKLTPLQLLWLDQVRTDPSEAASDPFKVATDPSGAATDPSEAAIVAFDYDRDALLTEYDLSYLQTQLNKYATKWRDIGTLLGFHPGELDNIQARPLLLQSAPESWLGAMLREWLQRAPHDIRGSSSIVSLMHALSKCGIGTKFEQ